MVFPEFSTAIAHLRDVLGDQTYESIARKGETMTTAAMATYAYDQIDQVRTELERRARCPGIWLHYARVTPTRSSRRSPDGPRAGHRAVQLARLLSFARSHHLRPLRLRHRGRAGVQKVTPHDLRHTCASLAMSAGVNVLAFQRMLGHTSAKVTLDTYADLFDDDLDAVAESLHGRYAPTGSGQNMLKMCSQGPGKGQ